MPRSEGFSSVTVRAPVLPLMETRLLLASTVESFLQVMLGKGVPDTWIGMTRSESTDLLYDCIRLETEGCTVLL